MTDTDAKADKPERLWAINIYGPDDLIPVHSYLEACRAANAFNAWWTMHIIARPLNEFDPHMWAVPIKYEGDPESHAFWLENPSPDYEDIISEANEVSA